MSPDVLLSLAILKVNSDRRQGDYIDNFVPFVMECIRAAPHAPVSLEQVREGMATTFGLAIPRGALKTILKRARRRGLITIQHQTYTVTNRAQEAGSDMLGTRQQLQRQRGQVLKAVVAHAKERYGVDWTPEESNAALTYFIEHRSVPILAAATEGAPNIYAPKGARTEEIVLSSFVLDSLSRDSDEAAFIKAVTKGSALARVLYYPDMGAVDQRFHGVAFYFDTAFLLRALGFAADGIEKACREVLDLLFGLNAGLFCFEHTLTEAESILSAAVAVLRSPSSQRSSYGETVEYFIDHGHTASDVELMIASLERHLEGLRIRVKPKPPHSEPLGLDEGRMAAILQEEVGYRNPAALNKDIDSLAAIHRLRRGNVVRTLERSRAVFVTTNL